MAFCSQCGAEVSKQGVFCPKCGASLQPRAAVQEPPVADAPRSPGVFSLSLNGRSPRSKFWLLFGILQGVGAVLTAMIVIGVVAFGVVEWKGSSEEEIQAYCMQCAYWGALIGMVIGVAFDLFTLPMYVRRWHDLNRSGWFVIGILLLSFIPIFGMLAMLTQFFILGCAAGKPGENRHEKAVPLWLCFWTLKLIALVWGCYSLHASFASFLQ